ncbi:uncharacterized protein LOC120524358 [Polypterus senegalus]|uniref:uncharacterized protein LOC120524358 n=1 Tax=Polypterus senegalus TaxID=55291 RepID=UPI0019661415|nr:uncharacterized protein LOC120524358 [Polypterus senegalus]
MIVCSIFLLFCESYVNPASLIKQPHRSVRAQLGASVDLECHMPTSYPDTYIWIKHTPGDAPETIVFWSNNGNVSYATNDGSTRYQVMKSSSSLNLSITHLNTSDLGTYYCGMVKGKVMVLGNGTEICLTDKDNQLQLDPVVLTLGISNIVFLILLVVCVTKKTRHGCQGKMNGEQKVGETFENDEPDSAQVHGVNYAALDFGKRNDRNREIKRDLGMEMTYSSIRLQ